MLLFFGSLGQEATGDVQAAADHSVQPSNEKVTVVIHCDFPPTYFFDKKENRFSGFFVDVMNKIAERAGLQVNYICESGWPRIIDKIKRGEADIGALTITGNRKKSLMFTDPFETANISFFMRSQSDIDISKIPHGYSVGMGKGSAVYENIKDRRNVNFVFYDSYERGLFSLLAGEIDLFAAPEPTIRRLLRNAGLEDKIKKVGGPIYEGKRCIAVRKGNDQLLNRLNKALRGFIGGPEYQGIYVKWYGKPLPYWTRRRIVGLSAALLFMSVCGMGLWRYRSVVGLNKELMNNIVERRKAEDSLRESNSLMDTMFQASPAAIFVVNKEGVILMWNKAAERTFGWSREEVVGRLNPIVPEDGLEEFRSLSEKILPEEAYLSVEVQLRKKDGSPIEVSISASSLYDTTGKANNHIYVVLDITQRKKLEEELLKTEKLESLGVVAGGIAHDFNNFLTAILGNIGLAKMATDPGSKACQWLAGAEKASLNAQGLTHQLLTFSKGGQPVMTLVAVGDLVRDTAGFALRGSRSTEDIFVQDGLWPVEADEGQLSQIIHNLVLNADQAMTGGGTVKVRCENVNIDSESGTSLKQGRYVKISIEDQGSGIPKDCLEKIFDPYFTTKRGGNGLGLAISYSIIKKHKGHIAVESELGRGTVFDIYLPASGKVVPFPGITAEPIRAGGGRILIMDDDEMVGTLAGEILKNLGYDVEFSSSGKEAIYLYQTARESNAPFDVVLMDLTIPGGMGGLDTIKRLLEIDPLVKAIVSSGYFDDPVMANFAEYGFKGVIKKPYGPSDLGNIVSKIVRGAQ